MEMFQRLRQILYSNPGASIDRNRASLLQSLEAFYTDFKEQCGFIKYFKETWQPKAGKTSRMSCISFPQL
jgi:hypothetical protein